MDRWPELSEVIERIVGVLSWMINIAPLAIGLYAFTLFRRSRTDDETESTPPGTGTPPTYASDDQGVFDVEDEPRDSQWGSAFDDHREKTLFGFDEAEWGSTFAEKPNDEPRIHV